MVCSRGYIKFKTFNELHNYLETKKGNSKGTPKELQRVLQSIVEYIIVKKSILVEGNPYLLTHIFKRYSKAAKDLALVANLDIGLAKQAIDWVSGWCKEKNYSWELETVVKHFMSGKQCNFKLDKMQGKEWI